MDSWEKMLSFFTIAYGLLRTNYHCGLRRAIRSGYGHPKPNHHGLVRVQKRMENEELDKQKIEAQGELFVGHAGESCKGILVASPLKRRASCSVSPEHDMCSLRWRSHEMGQLKLRSSSFK